MMSKRSPTAKGTKSNTVRSTSHVASVHHVQHCDSDSDSSDDDPFGLNQLSPPHSMPIYEDSRAGRSAWQCEQTRIEREMCTEPIPDDELRAAHSTLATVAADYEGFDSDDDSSSGGEAWYENHYYDDLDFY